MFELNQIQREKGINLLMNSGLYNPATLLCWSYIRDHIFEILFKKGIHYESTDQAIKEFFLLESNLAICEKVYSLYIISTMADWDNKFFINESSFEKVINNFSLLKHFLVNFK